MSFRDQFCPYLFQFCINGMLSEQFQNAILKSLKQAKSIHLAHVHCIHGLSLHWPGLDTAIQSGSIMPTLTDNRRTTLYRWLYSIFQSFFLLGSQMIFCILFACMFRNLTPNTHTNNIRPSTEAWPPFSDPLRRFPAPTFLSTFKACPYPLCGLFLNLPLPTFQSTPMSLYIL